MQAHQLRPAIIDIEFTQNALVNVKIQTNLESLLAGIGATHEDTDDSPKVERYNELRQLNAQQLKQEFSAQADALLKQMALSFDGGQSALTLQQVEIPPVGDIEQARLSYLYLSAPIPENAEQVTWYYAEALGNNVAHFYYQDQPQNKISHWLTDNAVSPVFKLNEAYAPKSFSQVALDYSVLGFEHIVPKGLDHILFVLGLFLLAAKMKPLLLQVTAFTLAHSLTLGLTIYGVISLSPSIVEPLIALSIAYVGIENIWAKSLKPWRIVVVFLFGLLHGMGFAGVLSELGLPESDFVTALIFFNVGVELGQLAVILLAFLMVFWIFNNHKAYRRWVIIPFSALIALVGLFWTFERVFYS